MYKETHLSVVGEMTGMDLSKIDRTGLEQVETKGMVASRSEYPLGLRKWP